MCTNMKLVAALAEHMAAAIRAAKVRIERIAEDSELESDWRKKRRIEILFDDYEEIRFCWILLQKLMKNIMITKQKVGDGPWEEVDPPEIDAASVAMCLDAWIEGKPW